MHSGLGKLQYMYNVFYNSTVGVAKEVISWINCFNSELQVPVFQTVDSAIQWISANKTYYAIHWIAIYPVDSAIHPSNNPAPARGGGEGHSHI